MKRKHRYWLVGALCGGLPAAVAGFAVGIPIATALIRLDLIPAGRVSRLVVMGVAALISGIGAGGATAAALGWFK